MYRTYRSAATVAALCRLSGLSLSLAAVFALGMSLPAHAEDSSVESAPSQAKIYTPKLTEAEKAALPTAAPTLQDDFAQRQHRLMLASAPAPAAAARRGGQADAIAALSPFPLALRLGAAVSPRTRFVAGLDATIPQLSIGQGFSTRADFDAIFSVNFGGITTLFPLTIGEIYSKGLVGGTRIYGGAAIGPYFGEDTRFGGKLIFGAEFTSRLGGEVDVHFPGFGDPIVTIEARVRL